VLEQGLAGLCQAGLILQQNQGGQRQFVFRHPIIQEVTYSMQLKVRRVALHGAVAQVMEAYHQDRLDEFAGLIAYHYEAANEYWTAAEYTARAARWIGATNAAQAIRSWRNVRRLLESVDASPKANRLRVMAGGQLGVLGWREGLSIQEVQPIIQEAIALASDVDHRLVQLLLVAEGRMLVACGGLADDYVELARRALALVEPSHVGRSATISALLCQALGLAGRLAEALVANTASMEGVDAIDASDREFLGFNIAHWLTAMRGRLLVRMGSFEEAKLCLQSILELEPSSIDPAVLNVAHVASVELALCVGDAMLAGKHADAATELAEAYQVPYLVAVASYCRGLALMISREYGDTVVQFARALELVRSKGIAMEFEPEILASLADCHLRSGDLQRARVIAEEAVLLSQRRSSRLPECRALIVVGATHVSLSSDLGNAAAAAAFHAASRLINQTGARAYEPLLAKAQTVNARRESSHLGVG